MRKDRSGIALGRKIRNIVLYVKFEMNFRHSSGNGKWSMGYMSLEFRREDWEIEIWKLSTYGWHLQT